MTKKKKFTFGKMKLIILVGVLVYVGFTYVSHQSVLAQQQQRQIALQQQKEQLERDIDFKKSELDHIGSNEYVEQQARERLGWLKEDEIKYVEGSAGVRPGAAQTSGTEGTPGETGQQATPTPSPTDEG